MKFDQNDESEVTYILSDDALTNVSDGATGEDDTHQEDLPCSVEYDVEESPPPQDVFGHVMSSDIDISCLKVHEPSMCLGQVEKRNEPPLVPDENLKLKLTADCGPTLKPPVPSSNSDVGPWCNNGKITTYSSVGILELDYVEHLLGWLSCSAILRGYNEIARAFLSDFLSCCFVSYSIAASDDTDSFIVATFINFMENNKIKWHTVLAYGPQMIFTELKSVMSSSKRENRASASL